MHIPELDYAPEMYYNQHAVSGYICSSRMIKTQIKLILRAFNLLGISDDIKTNIFLDIGCGSGLAENFFSLKKGYFIGIDISFYMLKLFSKRNKNTDSILIDISNTKEPFRVNIIDFRFSISCIQWLKNLDHLNTLIYNYGKSSLFNIFRSKNVIQFFPLSEVQLNQILYKFKDKINNNFFISDKNSKKTKKKYFIFYRN